VDFSALKRAAGVPAILLAMGVASCVSPPAPADSASPAHSAPAGHPAPAAVSAARTARLYPANNGAQAGGVRTAQLRDEGAGHGTIEFTMPYGETIHGEYSAVSAGASGFGSIYNAVFGPQGVAATKAAPSGSPGTVTGYGAQGTRLECEYYSTSEHASGACRTSTGFLYRFQY